MLGLIGLTSLPCLVMMLAQFFQTVFYAFCRTCNFFFFLDRGHNVLGKETAINRLLVTCC